MQEATGKGREVESESGDFWSPEMTALLATARGVSNPELETALSKCGDFYSLLALSERHGLSSLLYRRFSELTKASPPAGFRQALGDRYRSNIQHGLRHTSVLLEVMKLFQSHGLTAIPYKGPVLSAQIYADPAVREAVDLDILLPTEEVMQASKLLQANGFRPGRSYAPGIEKQLLKYRAELGLTRDGVLVELQWRIAPKYFSTPINVRELAERANRMNIAGMDLPVLTPEDNLLVLCIHGAKHHWQTLKWLLDVDLLVRGNPLLEWRLLQQRAEAAGVERILRLGLRLATKALQTPVPEEISTAVQRDTSLKAPEELMLQSLRSGTELPDSAHHRLMLQLRENWSDRILYRSRLAWQPTESEWDSVSLPRPLHFGYHFVRLGRVLAKALGLAI